MNLLENVPKEKKENPVGIDGTYLMTLPLITMKHLPKLTRVAKTFFKHFFVLSKKLQTVL